MSIRNTGWPLAISWTLASGDGTHCCLYQIQTGESFEVTTTWTVIVFGSHVIGGALFICYTSSIETYFIGFISPLCSHLPLGLQVVSFLDVFEPVCTFPLNVMCSVEDLFFLMSFSNSADKECPGGFGISLR